jgi:peptidyl-prolyl cis-trans isomerase C
MMAGRKHVLLLLLGISLMLASCATESTPASNPSKEKPVAAPKAEPTASTPTKATPLNNDPAKPSPTPPDKDSLDRVLVTVNGVSLTYEQANILVQHRVARDVAAAAQRWVDIQLKKQEAQRRKLDTIEQNAFVVQLYADNYLGFRILHDEVRKTIPPVTEADARKKYDQQIKNYQQPATYDLQHITLADETEAKKIAEEAKKPDANFDELVRQHSADRDKANLGNLKRWYYDRIKMRFGEDIAAAIQKAKPGELLGPIAGLKQFEIIKVISTTPATTTTFEDVKGRIMQQLNSETQLQAITKLLEDLKRQAQIEKSAELLELEKKAAETQRPTPGRPNVGGRPARTIVPRTPPTRPMQPTPPPPAPKKEP